MADINERKYVASSRNGYTSVDEYTREHGEDTFRCLRQVDAYKTKKLGESVAAKLNQAYADGQTDNQRRHHRAINGG